MTRIGMFTRGASVAALVALGSVPALADGKGDRAQDAILAAQTKVDAANKLGATGNTPAMIARAQAAIAHAQEDASAGHKERSIHEAIEAQQLADTAFGEAQREHEAARASANAQAAQAQQDAQAAQADAQQRIADANARADNASAAAQDSAQRAAAAEENANAANAAANAARSQPTVVTTTTEKTTHAVPAHKVVKVVRRPAGTAVAERTTTTVSTGSPQ